MFIEVQLKAKQWVLTSWTIGIDTLVQSADYIKKSSLVFHTPQVFDFLKVDFDAALLPSSVDLTGNVNMSEKFGRDKNRDSPDPQCLPRCISNVHKVIIFLKRHSSFSFLCLQYLFIYILIYWSTPSWFISS